MNLMNSKNTSVLHINDAITPGGSLVVINSLITSTSKQNITNTVIISEETEKLDLFLKDNCYSILKTKYSYSEHSQLISNVKNKKKYNKT